MSNAWLDLQNDRRLIFLRIGKDLPEDHPDGDRLRLVVTAQLHQYGGNPSPHFSVTADLIDRRRRRHDDIVACGQLTEEVKEHFPELAPIVALHSSDDEGVPLHAHANGVFFMGLTASRESNGKPLPDLDIVARHFRITTDEAADMVKRHRQQSDALKREIDDMRPRWKAEADAGIALLLDLGATDHRESRRNDEG